MISTIPPTFVLAEKLQLSKNANFVRVKRKDSSPGIVIRMANPKVTAVKMATPKVTAVEDVTDDCFTVTSTVSDDDPTSGGHVPQPEVVSTMLASPNLHSSSGESEIEKKQEPEVRRGLLLRVPVPPQRVALKDSIECSTASDEVSLERSSTLNTVSDDHLGESVSAPDGARVPTQPPVEKESSSKGQKRKRLENLISSLKKVACVNVTGDLNSESKGDGSKLTSPVNQRTTSSFQLLTGSTVDQAAIARSSRTPSDVIQVGTPLSGIPVNNPARLTMVDSLIRADYQNRMQLPSSNAIIQTGPRSDQMLVQNQQIQSNAFLNQYKQWMMRYPSIMRLPSTPGGKYIPTPGPSQPRARFSAARHGISTQRLGIPNPRPDYPAPSASCTMRSINPNAGFPFSFFQPRLPTTNNRIFMSADQRRANGYDAPLELTTDRSRDRKVREQKDKHPPTVRALLERR